MKKLKFLPLLLALLTAFAFASCDDNDDKPIPESQLPSAAKSFVEKYFPSSEILSSRKDKDEYEITLVGGTTIDFYESGEWKDVDGAPGIALPKGFYPEAIDSYLESDMAGAAINEISRERHGYDVELVDGRDLEFDPDGTFIRIDI